jgi:hypothetical protein
MHVLTSPNVWFIFNLQKWISFIMNTHIHYVLYVDILKHVDVLQENPFTWNVGSFYMVA